jgi:hypothetical protein
MGFLDLPSEIIDVIIDLGLPSGIEGLVLTCKALHGRAKTQIERHSALKRQWRCAGSYSTPVRGDLLSILYEMSLDPLVAQYIEVLDFWNQETLGSDYSHSMPVREGRGDGYNFRADAEAMENVKEMMSGSNFLLNAQLADLEAWWDELLEKADDGTPIVRREEQWRATIILLGMLPNLRVLRLARFWIDCPIVEENNERGREVRRGFAGMVSAANASGGSGTPLGKLEAILPFMVSGYEEKAGLQLVEPFLTLNSLTEVYLVSAVAVHDGYTGIQFNWRSPNLSSSINRLELVSCCIDAEGLSNLVAHTPKLSIFKYSHETKWHGCQHDWNPGTFVEALAHHCGNTIREVALTIDELFGEIENGASSFLALPNIQKLEVDLQVFCGPPVESGQRLGENPVIPHGDRAWTTEDIPCIGSMMPTGVVEVQINTGFPDVDTTALIALLKNLRDQRKERLHNLGRVIVRQYGSNSAQAIADWSGTTLEPFDEDVQDMRLRSQMPEWKRDFSERVASLAQGFR